MRRLYPWVVILAVAILAYWLTRMESHALAPSARESSVPLAPEIVPQQLSVHRGSLIVWNHYLGQVNAENTVSIFSKAGASAVITFLVPEGTTVKQGQTLVRFDATDAERSIVKLQQDEVTAASELRSLTNAELPIDLENIRIKVAEQTHKVQQEDKFLSDSAALEKQGLLSAEELSQERSDAATQREKLAQLRQTESLTEQFIDPAKIAQARAKLAAAQEALRLGQQQLQDAVIRAPISGTVIYMPITIDGGYRTVRVGDTVYKNQVFMMLPNTSRMVVECYVPESDFGELRRGMTAMVSPVSRPGMQISGTVLRVDPVAGMAPNEPTWQRYFHTIILLADGPTGLYPGMSVSVNVLAYDKSDALLVPRVAVHWDDGQPYVIERSLLGDRKVTLQLGRADMTYYDVLSGIQPGATILAP